MMTDSVEKATRQAVAALDELVDLDLDGEAYTMSRLLEAVAEWETSTFPSSGEQAMADLVYALWNGSRSFGIAELGCLDRPRRHAALEAISTWVRATT